MLLRSVGVTFSLPLGDTPEWLLLPRWGNSPSGGWPEASRMRDTRKTVLTLISLASARQLPPGEAFYASILTLPCSTPRRCTSSTSGRCRRDTDHCAPTGQAPWGPLLFECSGEVNSPSAKVFALQKRLYAPKGVGSAAMTVTGRPYGIVRRCTSSTSGRYRRDTDRCGRF